MRFDSTLFYHVGDPVSWPNLFDEMHETIELLDELDFTGVWLAEHHFAWDGWYRSASNPLLFGADVARWSDRLRMGQCGLITPDWHPLRLAEDVAFLDQMTKGRVDIGVAPGINSRACMQFHAAADRRDRATNRKLYEETVEVMLKALTEETFSHDGEFYRFPAGDWTEINPMANDPRFHEDGKLVRLGISPRPYQQPRPPCWAMSESVSSAEFCARVGIGTMSQSLSVGRIRQNWERYREVATGVQGREMALGEGLAIMRNFYVAETMEAAVEATRPGSTRLFNWSPGNPLHIRSSVVLPEELQEDDESIEWLDFQIRHGTALIGTPDSVGVQIERLRDELNCQHLALFLNIPGLSFEQVKRSLRLFANEVAPRFNS